VYVSVINVEDGVEIGMSVVVYLRLLIALLGYVVYVVGSTGVKDIHVTTVIVE
tara:strand:- start:340 stop:498 length:159 start_codon:yes stop_codon:yes gene_type:complete